MGRPIAAALQAKNDRLWHISEELIRRGNVRLLVESGRPSERKRTNKRRGMWSEQDNAGESSQSLDGIVSDNGMLSEVILPPARQELEQIPAGLNRGGFPSVYW